MTTTPTLIERTCPVSRPAVPLPVGAWDTHAHVFGLLDRYPLQSDIAYAPPLSTSESYISMLDGAGFDHGVLVHPSAYGWDNSAMCDALEAHPRRLGGASVLPHDISDAELLRLNGLGVRGIRFTQAAIPTGRPGALALKDVKEFVSRLSSLGWYCQVWAQQSLILEHFDMLAATGLPLVFDHMASCEVAQGVKAQDFQRLLARLKDSPFYVKLTPGRVSTNFPNFEDVRPFHDAFVEAMPDRLVFGSDWPFIGSDPLLPDVGKMVDLFDEWTPDQGIRQKVFVENPARFFGTL